MSQARREPARAEVRLRLRTKLLFWTLLVVNVAFVSVWFISTRAARQGMFALAEANLGLGAENLADAVAQLVNDSYADGLTTSRLDLPAQAIETGDPKNIAWYSDEMVQQKGRYAAIVVADRKGWIVAANTVGREGAKVATPLLGRSLGDPAWAREALASPPGKGVWVPPSSPAFLEGAISEPDGVVGFSFPVLDVLRERIGTLTILVSLSSIGKQLDGYRTGTHATESAALLLDSGGVPVALPSNLADRSSWKALRVPPAEAGRGSLVDPSGAAHVVVRRPVGGAARPAGWQVAATKTTAALEAPVDLIGNRLLVAFLAAVLVTTAVLILAADRLVRPIQSLTAATRSMGKASEYRALEVRTADEVGALTASFNRLFESLRQHEEGLEEMVVERTLALETARGDLADILDNMRQGIFTIGADGRVGNEFSAFCRSLFAEDAIGGADAVSLLQIADQGDRHAEVRMRFWLENVFGADELQWILASDDGVKSLTYRPASGAPRFLELEYAPVFKSGGVSKVMVIAKDVTELRSLEQEIRTKDRSHEASLARIAEIAAMDADLFATFTAESGAILARCDAAMGLLATDPGDRMAIDEIFRAVHTLKGNARIFHITSVQDLAHDVESEFQQLRDGSVAAGDEALEKARARIEALRGEFVEIERLGEKVLFRERAGRRGPTVRVAESRLLELRRRFEALARTGPSSKADLDGLGAAVQALTLVPLGELFDPFRKLVLDLGHELGKRVNDLEVAGDDVAVDPKLIDRLRDVLVHAARNALAHGLEGPEERRKAGKPEKGTVRIEARWEGAHLVLALSDDGAGFDLERLKREAFERRAVTEEELDALDDAAAIDLAFLPGLSTSGEVTRTAGRGVGMDVVRKVLSALRGTVTVSSERGIGSTVTMRIPSEYQRYL